MDTTDPMVDLFLSGKGHVYYGLLTVFSISGFVLFGANPSWLILAMVILAMIFVDLWCHWYAH